MAGVKPGICRHQRGNVFGHGLVRLHAEHGRLEQPVQREEDGQHQPCHCVGQCLCVVPPYVAPEDDNADYQYRQYQDGQRADGQCFECLLESDVLRCVAACAEDAVGHQSGLQGGKQGQQDDGQPGEHVAEGAYHGAVVAAQPQDVFGQEEGDERIDGEQVDAPFALGYAVEDENQHRGQEGEQPCVVHAADGVAQAFPSRFQTAAYLFVILQYEERHQPQQRVGRPSGEDGHHVVPPRVLVRLVAHLAQEAPHVFFQYQCQKLVAPLAPGCHVPEHGQYARCQRGGGEQTQQPPEVPPANPQEDSHYQAG